MAIDVFLIITGYFQCTGKFKWKKLLNLYLLIKFYRLTIYGVFLLSGYSVFSVKELFKTLFNVSYGFGSGFTSAYLAVYAFSPFINILITNMDKKIHTALVAVALCVFSIVPTFFLGRHYEIIAWYVVMYLTGAWLHLYMPDFLQQKKSTAFLSLASLLLSWASVAVIYAVAVKMRRTLPYYYFVNEAHKPLAYISAVFLFCFFKSLNMGAVKFINILSASTFGVLLIHASSNTMRVWLWRDVCNMKAHFIADSTGKFFIHLLVCTAAVYAVCVCIDLVRRGMLFGLKKLFGKKIKND